MTCEPDSLVHVYRNLHKRCWSVRRAGVVVLHADALLLHGVEFRVWEGGRQRVLRERKKNVHAFVVGRYGGAWDHVRPLVSGAALALHQVKYNPYLHPWFYEAASEVPVQRAACAFLGDTGQVFIPKGETWETTSDRFAINTPRGTFASGGGATSSPCPPAPCDSIDEVNTRTERRLAG